MRKEAAGPFHAFPLGKMSAVRMFLSIPALLLALTSLAGCYDLSAPSGPRREDFLRDPGAAEAPTDTQRQGEQAQAERSEQAAAAATKTVATDTGPALTSAVSAEMTLGEYVARYLQPAAGRD